MFVLSQWHLAGECCLCDPAALSRAFGDEGGHRGLPGRWEAPRPRRPARSGEGLDFPGLGTELSGSQTSPSSAAVPLAFTHIKSTSLSSEITHQRRNGKAFLFVY